MPHLDDDGKTLVLYGDVPLIQQSTLHQMRLAGDGLVLLTVNLPNPTGYGRIVRDAQGDAQSIVEE
jgi:bifunctional UDP-N-acetylglucosamine pyrophosphorylase/glucosamine-1-phosphate N-acetyltransferase